MRAVRRHGSVQIERRRARRWSVVAELAPKDFWKIVSETLSRGHQMKGRSR